MVIQPDPIALGDDVRRDLILDEGDAVAQLQLALLQALQRHRSPRRDPGAPAAAAQVRPAARAHLRRSWSTLAEKRDEIAKGCGNPVGNITPAGADRKRANGPEVPKAVGEVRVLDRPKRMGSLLTLPYIRLSKIIASIRIPIDRFGQWCKLTRPDRI